MTEEIMKKIAEDVNSRKRSNQSRREKSLLDYYSNPNYCKYCGKMIGVELKSKASETKVKQFCDRSCATSFNNSKKPKREKQTVEKIKKESIVDTSTKKELFSRLKNWQTARTAIRKRAQITYDKSDKPKQCSKCGYDKHYEICHIKAVSDFSDDSLISEINDIDNLVALCPNCHWEFDNGLLKLD